MSKKENNIIRHLKWNTWGNMDLDSSGLRRYQLEKSCELGNEIPYIWEIFRLPQQTLASHKGNLSINYLFICHVVLRFKNLSPSPQFKKALISNKYCCVSACVCVCKLCSTHGIHKKCIQESSQKIPGKNITVFCRCKLRQRIITVYFNVRVVSYEDVG